MISYRPLLDYMYFNRLKKKYLVEELKLHPSVVVKFEKNENVSLDAIVVICQHFNIPIEQVVEVILKTDKEAP